ncbi:MAG: hypothetical protein ACEQSR_00505 [Candidatus Methylacidiphilales bacterium]
MKQTKTFTILLFAILLINACGKDCPDSKPIEKEVDKSYLPYIIPYSDTSTRLFLKNGTDTLLFKSQGLKETKTLRGAGEGSCDKYNLQQLSLKMAASDSDFFEVSFFAKANSSLNYGNYNFNYQFISKEIFDDALVLYYPPVIKINILNTVYDTVNVVPLKPNGNIYSKKYIGIIKIETSNSTYELIK